MQDYSNGNVHLERELDEFFETYREACPAPAASANYMPELWDRIDRRRSFSIWLNKLAPAFATVTILLCLVFGALSSDDGAPTVERPTTYVDVLEDDPAADTPEFAAVVWRHEGPSGQF